ncbi:MAG: MOSC domain-containing protein [Planctomycetota bacterium]|nr:MOSC domain-containing protein [Planctomycetota bacterium]
MGTVLEIWTAPKAKEPMVSQTLVQAVAGAGLVGDRYRSGGSWSREVGTPDRELTLIESEQLEWFEKETGSPFPPSMTRRNVLTSGISLNELVGKRLRIGSVELEGMRLCEMCKSLQDRCGLPLLPAMVHRGGLNCQIITGGEIRVGDAIEPIQDLPGS